MNAIGTPIIPLKVAIEKHRLWPRLRMAASNARRTLSWWQMVDRWAAEARKVIDPVGTFRFYETVSVEGSSVDLGDGVRLSNLRKARLLKNARKIALCGLTLGPELENRCNDLAVAGDHPEASLLSMIGDCALAEAQTRLLGAAQEVLGGSLTIGVSLQPGAPYWDIEGNRVFFEVLPLESIGMVLLDSCSLSPAKSKTFACAFLPHRQPSAEGSQ